MGQRVERYHRDQLRKIALPGKAVTALFWILPVGKWKMGELDTYWDHFTTPGSRCHDFGLLLVRDTQSRQRERQSESTNLSNNLSTALAECEGGDLFDLVPEAEGHGSKSAAERQLPGFLVLSGAYPQPGWGVLVPVGTNRRGCKEFEVLIDLVIRRSVNPIQLKSIKDAARAFHVRSQVESECPAEPIPAVNLAALKRCLDIIPKLANSILTDTPQVIKGCLAKAESALASVKGLNDLPGKAFWTDLVGCTKSLRTLGELPAEELTSLAVADEELRRLDPPDQDEYLRTTHPRTKAAHIEITLLRSRWPELNVYQLAEFLSGPFRKAMHENLKSSVAQCIAEVEQRYRNTSGEAALARQRYEAALNGWQQEKRAAERDYRSALPEASRAQWELGPRFLLELECEARQCGFAAISVPWDPARMVGWKLHLANPEIRASDLVLAANSVLGGSSCPEVAHVTADDFHGSLFADYAYYVSISARKLSAWNATRCLCTELLSIPQMRKLLAGSPDRETPRLDSSEALATELLASWGWQRPPAIEARPLAACVATLENLRYTLVSSPNETRISLEGFLKDLSRATIATLGWSADVINAELSTNCPQFRRTSRKTWDDELACLTSGAALILLKDLLPLAFPDRIDESGAKTWCEQCQMLLRELNKGSHDPPLPAPTEEELAQYAETIRETLAATHAWVGEMPWHLAPTQTFGSDPLIVTGNAWSHSHPEERLIRVMLWAGEKPSREYLVWNKTLTNPVMTDAVLL